MQRLTRRISALEALVALEDVGGTGELGAAPGTPAYNPTWYALTDIYWDPVAGSDNNGGNVIGAPVKTFAEIVRRYGSESPQFSFGHSVTVHQLSAQPANQDPVFFEPKVSGGGQAILDARAGWVVAGADFASGALSGGFGYAGAVASVGGTPLVIAGVPTYVVSNVLLFNAARGAGGSYCFVDSVGGGNATMQQPLTGTSLFTPPTAGAQPAAVAVNTWVAADVLRPYTVPTLNLKRWSPSGADVTVGGQVACGYVIGAQIVDASAALSVYVHECKTCFNVISCCVISTGFSSGSTGGRNNQSYVLGCSIAGAISTIGACVFYGGAMASGAHLVLSKFTLFTNTIVHGAVSIFTNVSVNQAFADGLWSVFGSVQILTQMYGTYQVNLYPMASWQNLTGDYVHGFVNNALLTNGALAFGTTTTTGSAYVGAGTNTDGITITPANIDTGAAGGGGLFDPLTGARFANRG